MRNTPAIVALDIGGANLKAAHSSGLIRIQGFELWKLPDNLAAALCALLHSLPGYDRIAVTMTGELCDCFETKRQGVGFILDAVAAAANDFPVWVWQSDGLLVDLSTARQQPLLAAAANWLALATFAGRFAPDGGALVIDVGSTTTDIIPLWQGRPVPRGRTDLERLRASELLYSGVRRTPVCALLGAEGAAELFATMLDVHLLLDHIAEDSGDTATADGRPSTKRFARARLARMLCADEDSLTPAEVLQLAERLCRRQVERLRKAVDDVGRSLPELPRMIILSGAGEFLARLALAQTAAPTIISLEEQLGRPCSVAACAYALGTLAVERAARGD